jgi:LPS sulfotransferase NodH
MNPYIPVSNPTNQPQMIRKGEATGQLTDPGEFFDKPSSEESWNEYAKAAEAMAAII